MPDSSVTTTPGESRVLLALAGEKLELKFVFYFGGKLKFHQNLSYSAYSKEFRELAGYVYSRITELQVQNPGHFNPTNTSKYLFSISIHQIYKRLVLKF